MTTLTRRSTLLGLSGMLGACHHAIDPIDPIDPADPKLTDPTTPFTADVHTHVFNAVDVQTALIFETVGLSKRDLLQRPDFAGFPLVETRARFHRAVRFGDLIAIESRIVAVRKSSFEVEHRLTNGGELSVEGFETRVWTMRDPNDPERMKSHPIPSDILAKLDIEVG